MQVLKMAQSKTGKQSLVIPLANKASLTINDSIIVALPKGEYKLILTDISGITRQQDMKY